MKDTNQKRKINDKLDFIKIINCSSKNATKEVQRQSTDWENISAVHISGNVTVSRISKEHLQINKKRQPNNKMNKRLEKALYKSM